MRQPGFKKIKCIGKAEEYKSADYVMEGGILIACHHGLNIQMIEHIQNSFIEFMEKYN